MCCVDSRRCSFVAYHCSATSPNSTSPRFGSCHSPRVMSASMIESQRDASVFVGNVFGTVRMAPDSGSRKRACQRPDGSLRTAPKRRRPLIGHPARFGTLRFDDDADEAPR